MTGLSAIAPAMLALAATLTCVAVRRIHPRVGARVVITLITSASLAAVAWMVVLSGAMAVQLAAPDGGGPAPIRLLRAHGPVPSWLGLSAAALLTLGISRAIATWRSLRREQRVYTAGDEPLVITSDEGIMALAVPGRVPRVVLSTGLLRALRPDEVRVVVAHERAHLTHHHHRFGIVARVAAGPCPWLGPAAHEVTYLLERWADENAAHEVGDRALVARAISRAALASSRPRVGLAFGPHHVRRRVDAMRKAAPPAISPIESLAMAGTGAAATGLAGSAMQLHHALPLLG